MLSGRRASNAVAFEVLDDFVAAFNCHCSVAATATTCKPASRSSASAASFAESFERLGVVKMRFDPDNVLRCNQNIPPAA